MELAGHDPFRGVKLLGAQDVQNFLGVSRSFMQKIIREKLLPCQQTSAGWIFEKSSVLAFQSRRLERAKVDRRIQLKKA